VYKLAGGATDTPGAFSTLHAFSGPDGAGASGDLIADALGNLYGTTGAGGANGLGTVFKIPGGATATPGALVTLATFNGTNGSNPLNAGLLADAAGNLFGVTNQGGTNNVGTVFMIPGGATATPGALTTLWSFSNFNTGSPLAGLIADGSGNLYGTTQGNIGTVYKISGAGFVVPAPGAVALLGLGGLMAARRRRGVVTR
jgi:uncharacterized repeat protein (TIGR03803 family)